ncbi:unnamed protein product [Owenia fusiformis]|uniref:Uncharacterized protein n=1 Tax=Owenia fusiformis TaxID=6347 RepID=A0A8J1UQL1_OWEFU|nr:unnamed protein product [Owenia fusiformis]
MAGMDESTMHIKLTLALLILANIANIVMMATPEWMSYMVWDEGAWWFYGMWFRCRTQTAYTVCDGIPTNRAPGMHPWFVATQVFANFGFSTLILALIANLLYIYVGYCYRKLDDSKWLAMLVSFLSWVSCVLIFFASVIFAFKYNEESRGLFGLRLSYSWGMSVVCWMSSGLAGSFAARDAYITWKIYEHEGSLYNYAGTGNESVYTAPSVARPGIRYNQEFEQ